VGTRHCRGKGKEGEKHCKKNVQGNSQIRYIKTEGEGHDWIQGGSHGIKCDAGGGIRKIWVAKGRRRPASMMTGI